MTFKGSFIKRFFFFAYLLLNISVYAQVKIGDNPSTIDEFSILELESSDKVLVITKMSTVIMNSITPLKGALVYNTTEDCIYTYDGISTWISLCGNNPVNADNFNNVFSSATEPSVANGDQIFFGDFWLNTNDNSLSIYDNQWIPIDANPRSGNGVPTISTAPSPLVGQIYVDESTGEIYAYDGNTWVNSNTKINANNGTTLVGPDNTVQLGGVLTRPTTVIETSANNTLAITGLEEPTNIDDNDVVLIDRTSGVLRRTSSANLFREEVIDLNATTDSQVDFTFPLKTTTEKVNVYRNGVRIDFTLNESTGTVTLEPAASCYVGDQIRIVQFY